jgi:hypothetical protein
MLLDHAVDERAQYCQQRPFHIIEDHPQRKHKQEPSHGVALTAEGFCSVVI